MSLIVEIPPHLSHSQADNLVGSYCPASQFFGRILGKPERPGWAQIGGSALHTATEVWDNALLWEGEVDTSQSRLEAMFGQAMDDQIAEVERTTTFDKSEWHRSGREMKSYGQMGGPNKKDEAWWRQMGPLMLAAWTTWRLHSGWEIASLGDPDAPKAGIEIPFTVEIGGTPVKGYIDRVFERDGEFLVVDLKSGREPDSTAQLGTYRLGLLRQYGVDPRWGAYWLGGTGLTTGLTDLRVKWPELRVERRFIAARRRQLAGEFDPKPSNLCGSCGVKEYCAEYGGDKAAETPQPWEVTEVRVAQSFSA